MRYARSIMFPEKGFYVGQHLRHVKLAFKFTHGVKDAGGTLDDSKLRPQSDKRTTAASPVFAPVVASD